MKHQLRFLREARRVGNADEMIGLAEMADALIEDGYAPATVAEAFAWPTQGEVTKRERQQEALGILRAWPEDALSYARRADAPWHTLTEPARWWRLGHCEREQLIKFARGYVRRHPGGWPQVDDFRRFAGMKPTRRKPQDADEQEELL